MSWTVLRLTTPSENAEVAAQFLIDGGCNGVQIEDSAVVCDESEDATVVTRPQAVVSGYLDSKSDVSAARCAVEQAIAGTTSHLTVESLPGEDWANAWRDNF